METSSEEINGKKCNVMRRPFDEEWVGEEQGIDISEWYCEARHLDGVWDVSNSFFESKLDALASARHNLPNGGKYGVLKVGTTKITDIRVKQDA